ASVPLPTACASNARVPARANTLPRHDALPISLRVKVLRSEEAKARLLPHMSDGNRDKTAAAPAVALLAADIDFHDELPKVFPHFPGARDLFADDEGSRAETAELNAGL